MKQLIQGILGKFGYGLRRLSTLESFVPFIRDLKIQDVSFRMWIANADASLWYAQEHQCKEAECPALKNLTAAGDRVLEIGSHHGFTGILLSRFVGTHGFVLGIEANPQNALIDDAQLTLNEEIKNLRFINSACSDMPGKLKIEASHNSRVSNKNNRNSIEVPAVTGDMLDTKYGPFNFIKVDVEGYELEVLKGCRNLLSRAPKLALELHLDLLREHGKSAKDVFELINIRRYDGTMVIRPNASEKLQKFDPASFPESGIVNVFLKPIKLNVL